MWICPACQSPLALIESRWCCTHNHSFDKAAEGYVNLLLANQKHSNDPGDNRQMINARRSFLDQGYYAPLVLSLVAMIRQHNPLAVISLYDAGCGEGYYLHQVSSLLEAQGVAVTAAGSDISKNAIQKAAKKYSANEFAVASSFNLPLSAGSQDTLLQIFAPAAAEEVFRVLRQGGFWLRVTPGPAHLQELKQNLYESPQQHVADVLVPEGFSLVQNQALTFKVELTQSSSREQLLMMTPYYWSVGQGALPVVLEGMGEMTADFTIRMFRKN